MTNDTFLPQIAPYSAIIFIFFGVKMYTCALIQVHLVENARLRIHFYEAVFRLTEMLRSR